MLYICFGHKCCGLIRGFICALTGWKEGMSSEQTLSLRVQHLPYAHERVRDGMQHGAGMTTKGGAAGLPKKVVCSHVIPRMPVKRLLQPLLVQGMACAVRQNGVVTDQLSQSRQTLARHTGSCHRKSLLTNEANAAGKHKQAVQVADVDDFLDLHLQHRHKSRFHPCVSPSQSMRHVLMES